MKHCKVILGMSALLLTALAGCSQPCYMRDYDDFLKRAGLPCDVACNPELQNMRTTQDIGRPMTVDDPERDPWYLTLHEAVALALENGNTGVQSTRNFGFLDDELITAGQLGPNNSEAFGTDSIRVLALTPAIYGDFIEFNESRYDAVLRSVLGFNTQDQPTGSSSAFRNGQFTAWGVSLEKANYYGGLSNITFGSPTNQGINPGTNFYSTFATRNFFSGTLNPQYTPDLKLSYSQPLLFGFGSAINSLLPSHPSANQGGNQSLGGYANNLPGAQGGIVIARITFDNKRADFERQVNFMLANVEIAYWNLYGAFVNLYSAEQALRQSHVAWKINKAKYDAGAITITQFAQIRGQYEQFRGDRLQALGKVLEAERILRGLMGLPAEDGKRLVPLDTPTVAPYIPDWRSALAECMDLRPELIMMRNDLKRSQLELERAKNTLLPDLRFEANYNIHGAGDRLDGNAVFANGLSENAIRVLDSTHFTDYSLGLTLAVPLGYRGQNAAVRFAKIRLAQTYLQLRDQEQRAQRYLVSQYRAVIENYNVIEARRAQRQAFADQVEARFKEFVAGKTTADFLLEAQRQWANALSVEYQAIVEYNNSLARFNFAKGTLMQHDGIQIAEGPLPECAQVRAVENERQRAKAIICHEEANVVAHPPCSTEHSANPCLPPVAPTLPALMNGARGQPMRVEDSQWDPRANGANPQTPAALPTTPGDLPVPPR